MSRHVALVDGKPGAYGVVVPDLPGCTSGGTTIDDALRNAVEAVTLWVEDARADGEKVPPPRTAEKRRGDPEVAAALADGGVLAYVPLVLDAARPVKANLSLDAGLLHAIDEAAERRGLTRSAFLACAAREKKVRPPAAASIRHAAQSAGAGITSADQRVYRHTAPWCAGR